MAAYYNEFEPYAAEWLRNLIKAGLIADGEVDGRSIVDVQPDDLRGFTQCHFFAGIAGWSYAARLAGWPDDRPLWTGSCPCQPFSVAGKGEGTKDERHLWPEFFRLIDACRPPVVMGEQVAAAVGKNWLDGVFADLEGIGYACGAAVVPACAVDAPHRRDRLWFVADAQSPGREGGLHGPRSLQAAHGERPSTEPQQRGADGNVGHANGARSEAWLSAPTTGQEGFTEVTNNGSDGRAGAWRERPSGDVEHAESIGRGEGWTQSELRGGRSATASAGLSCCDVAHSHLVGTSEEWEQRGGQFGRAGGDTLHSPWANAEWIIGHDGKARRVEPSVRLLAHGVPARVGKLRAAGNAIVPQVAAEVIAAFMEARP